MTPRADRGKDSVARSPRSNIASSPYVVTSMRAPDGTCDFDELSHLAYQLAMVDRRWSVRRVPAEDGAEGCHDLRVALQLHCLQIGQHRAQIPLMDLGDLQVALALGEAFGQRSDFVATPLQFGLSVGKLLPLRADACDRDGR